MSGKRNPLSFHDDNSTSEPAPKRRKPSPNGLTLSPIAPFGLPTPSATETEPSSPEKAPTLNLSLKIPQTRSEDVSKNVLIARKGAATRWRKNLQNPYPTAQEIKDAYPLKLIRHYPARADTTPPQPLFSRPRIEKSDRVMALLKQFPKLEIPTPPPRTIESSISEQQDKAILRANRAATATDEAMKLAWNSFQLPKRNTTRHFMIESGLRTEDLVNEYNGVENRLPEWYKFRTHPRYVTPERKRCIEKMLRTEADKVRAKKW
ncbi:hypothetical protein K505DRAFT_248890 [Melanomma pulvis-pyrius CBS 109.77]|uniref:Uncharacterized protein n=1 Tax=Melanomma pulvis-pyrius CBS 109.77 TaxID=1314802 RepID=A0A6A6X5Q7_9PLEO|nr:hypothetical protein K505DRAFT_248890 [Melanomma pulvis-pyrius CBS 109.77]